MEKFLKIAWAFLTIALICLILNDRGNEKMIASYKNGEYELNTFTVFGFTEPYIAPYNQGNVHYQQKDYEQAMKAYQQALEKKPPHDKECQIRINLVLARLAKIKPEEIAEDQVEEVIQELEDIKEVLFDHECATRDGGGHNEDAKRLVREIDEFEESLKQQGGDGDRQDNPPEDESENQDEDEEKAKENRQKKEEQLKESRKQGMEERSSDMSISEQINDFSYYDGAAW